MAYSEAVLYRAKARLAQAKQEREEEDTRRIDSIYEQYPRLRAIDRLLKATMVKVVAASFQGGDPRAAVEAAKQENLSLQEERSWILQAAELEEDDLESHPICTDCGGSGYVGERMCACLKELCRQEQKKELSSLLGGRETFEGFSLQYYSETPDPDFGVSPRQMMRRIFDRCLSYARDFSVGASSLLFTGGPGLGKTYLSACIARAVAERGYSVVYDTAGKMFSDFEAAKFGGEGDATAKYLACDLLIIDDLGTEMVTQFTQSALYQVINTRLMEGRATIVSTNLGKTDIERRYLPAIASRLLGTYDVLPFLGDDIRMMR